MRDKTDDEDEYDYGPNELAELSRTNPDKYQKLVQSNLEEGDTVQKWEQRNLEYAQKHLHSK